MHSLHTDRINPITRLVGGGVIVVLVIAFIALYIFPEYTDVDFAWTIQPATTAIIIGAGYLAGAYFFARVVTEKQWHHVQAGFLAITLFTIWMLVATLLHWNRFNQGTIPFYAWTVIYVITPILVPALWWQNRKHTAQELDDNDLRFAPSVRWGLYIVAGAGITFCLFVLVQPAMLIPIAPWKLSELTARVFAGWSALTFVTILTIALDGRWSTARILVQSAIIGQALTLLAMPRIWNDLDQSKPMALIFVVGLGLAFLALGGIHLWADRLCRQK